MAKTFRELHHDAAMNPAKRNKTKKKEKSSFFKSPVSTDALTAGQCLTGWTHNSTTFKAKIKSKRHENQVIKPLHTFK